MIVIIYWNGVVSVYNSKLKNFAVKNMLLILFIFISSLYLYFIINQNIERFITPFQVTSNKEITLLSKNLFYWVLFFLILVYILLIIIIFKYIKLVEWKFFVISSFIGICLVLIVPPFDQLDEMEHYYRAYEVSEFKYLNQNINGHLGNYIPTSLIETVNKVRYIHQEGYRYDIVKSSFSTPLNVENKTFYRNYASMYPPLLYIPQAIGVWISKMLGVAPIVILYIGRMLNLFTYIIISFLAIKITPFKKQFLFLICLLPMSLIQASSLSADGLTISSAILFTSFILKVSYDKENVIVKNKKLLILTILGIIVSCSKIVYIPLVLLFFLIPHKKIGTVYNKYYVKILFLVLISILPMIIWNILNLDNLAVPDMRGGPNVSPDKQIQYIINHPISYVKVIFNTLITSGMDQFYALIGKYVTNYQYQLTPFQLLGFLFLIFVSSVPKREYSFIKEDILVKDKFIILFIAISILVLIYTALYTGFTNISSPLIAGVQGRYFLPIFFMTFLCFSTNKIVILDKEFDNYFTIFTFYLLYYTLIDYILKINAAIPF